MITAGNAGYAVIGVMDRIGKQILEQSASIHGTASQRLKSLPNLGMGAQIYIVAFGGIGFRDRISCSEIIAVVCYILNQCQPLTRHHQAQVKRKHAFLAVERHGTALDFRLQRNGGVKKLGGTARRTVFSQPRGS